MKYINAELLREEIEKIYKSEIQPWLSGVSPKSVIYEYVLPLIDSLQQEQPEVDLETFDKSVTKMWGRCAAEPNDTIACLHIDSFIDVARHFFNLGCTRTAEKYDEIEYNRQRAEESVPKDLEEHASRAGFDYVDNIVQEHPGHRFNDHDVEYAYRDAFIAGAKWQEDHTPLPEDTVLFNKGVEEGKRLAEEEQADMFTIVALDAAQRAKEQMMKDAVKWLVDDDYHDLSEKGRFILGSVGLGYNGYYIPYSDLLKLPKEDEK